MLGLAPAIPILKPKGTAFSFLGGILRPRAGILQLPYELQMSNDMVVWTPYAGKEIWTFAPSNQSACLLDKNMILTKDDILDLGHVKQNRYLRIAATVPDPANGSTSWILRTDALTL